MIDRLPGAWDLRSFTVAYSDGRPSTHPYGPDARGRIVYTDDGFVSAVLSRAHRSGAHDLETARRAAEHDKARWFDGYLSYTGRWRLEDDEVVHTLDLALLPAAAGTEVRRQATFAPDGSLTLSYTRTPASGVTRTFRLVWERA
jgi:hypothetical protein